MSPIRLFAYLVSRVASHGAAHVLVPLGIAVVAVIAALAGVLYHDLPESAVAASRPGDTPASDTVVVWGPRRFVGAEPGRVGVEVIALTVVPTRRYTLRVRNGAPDGTARVTGGEVVFNNWQVVSPDEFGTGRYEWSRVVQPRGADTLFLNVAGPGGSYVTVELLESADASFVVFGVERFTAATSGTVTRTFNISPTAAAPYRLCLANGDPDGTNRVADVEIRLNGVEVVSRAQGFSAGVASLVRDVPLMQGANTLEVTLPTPQPAGFLDLCVTATDVTPPVFSIDAPGLGVVTRDTVVTVSGIVDDRTPTTVTVNGVTAQRTGDAYSAAVPLAAEGGNVLTISVVDGAGLRTDSTRAVVRDREAPILTVTAPADGQVTNQNTAGLAGTVSDVTAVTVSANGVPVPVDSAGGFVASVPLALGANLVTVTASDPAGNQAVVVRSLRRDPGVPDVAMSGAAAGFSCLDQGGPLVTLSGVQTQRYHNVTLADSTKIDARTAQWIDVAETQTMFATRIGGGVNLCWSGGELLDSFPPATSWFTMLNRYGHRVKPSSATDLEDMRIFNYGYGVLEDLAASNWTVRRTLVRYSRATCISNEGHNSGTIEDSFLDGCFRAVGSDGPATLGDSSANVVVIRNSLIRLQVVDSSYFPEVPNHSAFWDWDPRAPRISLFDNVFRADARSREGQSNGMYMAPPPGKLAECSGNIMVWLGQGPFPEPLPPCFTLTTDVAVWDNAVAVWNAAYPPVLPDLSPPIVSMFQPGVVGDTILTGTVTLIATAVDDRAVAGVQFQLDGQDIGEEQASPTPYVGPDASLNRDFTTKYRILWNSASVGNGTHALRAVARDAAGQSTTSGAVSVTVSNAGGLPPDPATVATAIDPTVATTIAASTAFLYSGADPIQTGLAAGTISPVRAAVVRGKVLTRDGAPLSGVTVRVLDHEEFGQTLSRADGGYDLAVNGGGPLTLDFAKAGVLGIQRQVDVPWQDFVPVPDVRMVALDTQVTTIDFSDPVEVARGTPVTDDDGTRQATVLFKQNTQATLVLPDGTLEPRATINVRATEYTVGPNGLAAMPAPLPPASAYTYAVELSADEAIAVGATEVRFSQPVPFYVENFLDFPVGIAVPMAFYDRKRAAWMPSQNGRVVRVVAEAGGLADLDITGDGVADDASVLGVNDAERQRLAELYAPAQELWRIPVTHFSPSDANFPDALPDGAKSFGGGGASPPAEQDNPCPELASIIECEDQTLGERVNVVGTAFSLNYRSDRVPGRLASRDLVIPISTDEVPEGLDAIVLEVRIAGQVFEDTFPPLPNQTTQFTWDGKDVYGRVLQGLQPVTIRIGYVYPGVYRSPAPGDTSFGLPGGDPLPGVESRVVNTLNSVRRTTLGNWDARAQGLAGWTLSVHHAYDPMGGVIYLGDGTRRSALTLGQTIRAFAGGDVTGFAGDGGPAADARLNGPNGGAVAADGSVYIADTFNGRVRRVGTDGIITTVAGTGAFSSGPDGGQATQTPINGPGGVAIGPDGALYIAEFFAHKVRRVDSQGIIATVAGTGSPGFGGDGGPATAALLRNPLGIVFGPDGSLYIADSENSRIRRVGPDGVIQTVAGTGIPGYNGDDILGTNATLNDPGGVALSAQGELYIADARNNRVRRVTADGIIQTVAGMGSAGFAGDGQAAVAARLSFPSSVTLGREGSLFIADCNNARIRRVGPDGIITTYGGMGEFEASGNGGPPTSAGMDACYVAGGPDGTIFVIEPSNDRVRAIKPTLPHFGTGEILIASDRGGEVYRFDVNGRHLATIDPLTRTNRLTFAYNGAGLLTTVTDAFGNATSIQRNGANEPVSITAPFGQQTMLGVDQSGNLATITNPANEAYSLTYLPGGLLQSFEDPEGGTSHFEYDGVGRLIRDEDASGIVVTLTRTETASGFQVTMRRDTLPIATYQIGSLSTGGQQREKEDAAGGTSTSARDAGGATTSIAPDGSTAATSEDRDPRFSTITTLDTARLETPQGIVTRSRASRTVELADPTDPFSISRLLDTVITNDRISLATYTAADQTFVRETPEHRQIVERLDLFGRVIEEAVPGVMPSQHAFDPLGRLAQTTQGSRRWLYTYDDDGRLATMQDPLDRTTQYFADLADRVTRKVMPGGHEILYEYDRNGNLVSATPSGQPAHRFQYTATNVLASYQPPALDGGTWSTSYTTNSNKDVTRILRPDGLELTFAYDTAGRITELTLPGGQIAYAYQPATGNPVTVTGPYGGSLGFEYDGSVLKRVTWAGEVNGILNLTYDADLQAQSLQVNGTTPVSFTYDGDGLLTQAGDLTITRAQSTGFISGTTLDQVTTTRSYSPFGEVATLAAHHGSSELFQVSYTRDALDRVTEATETIGGMTTTRSYGYDLAGRLSSLTENGITTAVYEYDGNGNRHRVTTPSGAITAVNDAQDRLLAFGNLSYSYTRNGELQTKTINSLVTTFSYDVLGNLKSVVLPGGPTIEYVVDGFNRRIGKKVNGALARGWLYQSQLNPVAELDENGQVVSRFIYGTRSNVPDYVVKGNETYQLITDHLGSVRLVVNATTGAIAQRLTYDPWGVVIENTNPGFQPFAFAGGLYDEQTGLIRFGARDYDAHVGRWTTKDPAGILAAELNAFAYAAHDPVNSIDPSGEQSEALAAGEILAKGWTGALVEPSPVGEVVMTGVTVVLVVAAAVATIADIANDISRPRQRGRWSCDAKCHGKSISSPCCPPFLYGFGSGPSRQIACMNAKYMAAQSAPRGCQARHCRCMCTKA